MGMAIKRGFNSVRGRRLSISLLMSLVLMALSLVLMVPRGVAQSHVELRINATGSDFTDTNGNLFVADKAFVAGDFGYVGSDASRIFTSPIAGTTDDLLYQSMRGGFTTFSYLFDTLPAGDYDVTLYFAEPTSSAGFRQFDVVAEGNVFLSSYDIAAAAGGSLTAQTESFTVNVSDAQLNLDFTPVTANRAIISAIEVVQAVESTPLFVDVTAQVGIASNHDTDSGLCGPPLGVGTAWADYDNDGDPDVFITNQGLGPNFLYRNDGDTNADGLPDFTDVAASLGVDDPAAVGLSAVFIDYDNDGDQDLYVTAKGGNTLWENQLVESGNVAVSFLDVTATAGLADFGRGITTAWGDFNGDSFLDMYVAKHFECIGVFPTQSDDNLYMNNGDGTFTEVTDYLCGGPGSAPCAKTLGYGFAPGWVDYDNDNDLDLYLVNDFLDQPANYPNVLWRNDGPDGVGGWLFTDVSTAAGVDIAVNGMGQGVGDYDNDGFFDFAFSNVGPNTLLRNEGDGTFTDVSAGAGVQRATTPLGDTAITWGTVFFDYDNDTNLDLYIAAGEISPASPTLQPNALFRNNGNGTFTDVAAGSGLEDPTGHGRNASIVDVDGDGFVDLMTGDFGDDRNFYNNTSIANGNTNNWLTVTVEGTVSNRDGIGTVIYLDTPDGTSQMRQISTGATHGGGDYRAAYFGLGSNATGDLMVRWPTGVVEDLGTVAINQALHLVEPVPLNEPDISVAPLSLDYGQVTTGTDSDMTVTVTNTGLQTLNVSAMSTTAGEFSVLSPATPFSVSPGGGSELVTVRFSPTSTGVVSGDLEISSDDPDTPVATVPLTGEGIPAPGPGLRINAAGSDYTDGIGNLFVADKAFVAGDFGYVGSDVARIFTGAVAGTTDDLLYQSVRGGLTTFSYLFDALAANDYDVTLYFSEPLSAPGGRLMDISAEGVLVLDDLDVAGEAGTAAALTKTFTVSVSDGQLNIDFTPVTANRAIISAIEVVETAPPPNEPDISVAPPNLDFGQVAAGADFDLTATVTNNGTVTLNVSAMSTTNPLFSVVGPATPFVVAAGGGTQDVTVRFSPTAVGVESGDLEITSDDPDTPLATVPLTGEGTAGLFFDDVTVTAGIAQSHDLDEAVCPAPDPPIGVGSAWGDFDNDGDQDLFVTNHGAGPHRFYRNDGDTDGDGAPNFTDIAVSLGMDDPAAAGHSAVFIDYDNDGDQDLYVTALGGNTLWENQLVESGNVAATFIDVTATAGLMDFGRGLTSAWGDFNGDSFLDVYIAKHFNCMPDFPALSEDNLYMNNGDGTFTEVTDYLCGGLGTAPCVQTSGYGFSPGWFDYDNDNDLDLYLVNDDLQAFAGAYNNVLWRNDGSDGAGGWLFTDVSVASGTDISANGMGLGVGDYDNNGFFDVAFSNNGNGPNYLLANQGDGTFLSAGAAAGVEWNLTPLGDGGVTWGTAFFDYNNDQWLDLYFVAGNIGPSTTPQPNPFFVNNQDGTFTDMSAASGLDDPGRGRNASMADMNGDGFVDVFVGNYGQAPQLYLNRAVLNGNVNHYLTVTVEGTVSNRDGIGTRLTLTTSDGVSQIREINSGPTHGGGDEKAAFFGLGSNTTANLTVRWPTGLVQDLGAVTIDEALHLVEPVPVNEPDIGVNPGSVAFGQVVIGTDSDMTVTVTNSGLQVLNVTAMSTTNPLFSVVSPATPFAVPALGGTQDVILRFSPAALGVEIGDLEITSDDPDTPLASVSLSGEGVAVAPLAFRINAAGPDFTDMVGELFVADKAFVAGDFGYTGSDIAATFGAIAGTTDDPLYQAMRGGLTTFSYVFDSLPADDYDVTLYFAEPASAPGDRVMDIAAEGVVVVGGLDVSAAVGTLTAYTETFTVSVSDGQLNIDFTPITNNRAIISAVEVIQVMAAAPAAYTFIDVTSAAGVADDQRGHFGVAWFDYDGDDVYDLYSANGRFTAGAPESLNTMFANNGDGTFSDVTTATQLADPWVAMRNVAADYDRDGDQDVYSHNFLQSTLYRNDGGVFTDVNSTSGAGLAMPKGTGAAWADYDNDGWVDLHATSFPGENALLRNNGDGTFTNMQAASGLPLFASAMGNAWGDYDNDGDQDIAVAAVTPDTPDILFRNNGDGTFTDVTAAAGLVLEAGGSTAPVTWGDYNNDGWLDLFISEVTLGSAKVLPTRMYLFRNNQDGTFTDVTTAAGIVASAGSVQFWDAGFADYDYDGDHDLFVTADGPNMVFRNNGDGTFTDIAPQLGLDDSLEYAGIGFADYDDDKDLDFYLVRHDQGTQTIPQPNKLFANAGGGNNWLYINLTGTTSNLDGIGARITATIGGNLQIYEARAGRGFFSQDSKTIELGLAQAASVDTLTIDWPSGITQTLTNVAANQVLDLVEPAP